MTPVPGAGMVVTGGRMGPGGFRRLQNGRDPTTSGRVGSIPARSRQPRFAHPLPRAGGLPSSRVTTIHERSRFLCAMAARCVRRGAAALALCGAAVGVAPAQRADSAQAGVRATADSGRAARQAARVVRDTLGPPISPRRAFLYSLVLPGLGQTRLQRPSAGALYAAFELTAVTMLAKSRYDLGIAKRRVKEQVVLSYRVDAEGRPLFEDGLPIPKDTVPNRYAVTGTDQLRSRVKARRLHYEDWVAMLFFTHLFSGADAFVSAHLFDLPRQVEARRLPSGATGLGIRLSIP